MMPSRNAPRWFSHRRWFYHRHSALLVALASAALVLLAAVSVYRISWLADEQKLRDSSRDLLTLLAQRLRAHEQILRGGVGLFEASDFVSRTDWHSYVNQLRLTQNFPGIQGVGFAVLLSPDQVPDHVAKIRSEGFPDYTLKPAGERPQYSAIVFLEPFSGRNLAAFGYDMLSEPTRAEAIHRALRTGHTTMTAKVTLVQETTPNAQPGFLMYVPAYRRGASVDDEDAREKAALGIVYSPFRVHDLMNHVLTSAPREIQFSLFDGDQARNVDRLLFSTASDAPLKGHQQSHVTIHTLHEYGHSWTLLIWLPDSNGSTGRELVWTLSILGGLITLLLYLLLRSLAKREQRANQIASEMTVNFQQSETALAASAQRARAIIDNVADAILTLQEDGQILQANPAAERLFGYPCGELIGCTIQTLMPAVPAEQLRALLREASHSQRQATTAALRELEGRRQDQTSVAIEMTLSAVPNAKPETFIAVCRDVSERRRVDRLKREFVATVSHELRTPLTSITGSLDLLVSDQLAPLPKSVHDLLVIAHRNSRRLGELINDLLDMEQISRGQLTLYCEPIDLRSQLEQALQAVEPLARAADVSLVLQAEERVMTVEADRKRLQQVLVNLLSNAIKFSPVHGDVRVHAQIELRQVRVSVTDQGPGVPTAFVPRLFEQFSRADGADNRRVGGTGLGLAISKELVERMHGRIGYQPATPQGACFYIELPLTSIAAP